MPNNVITGEETVTISKAHYNELTNAQRKLNALEAGGVDNWEGYDFAMEDFHASEDQDEV